MRNLNTKLLGAAFTTWLERNAFQHTGSLAFFTLFSLAPLVIILVAIVGAVFGQQAATGEIAANIRSLIGPQAASAVQEAVSRSRPDEAGILPTLLGIGALLFGDFDSLKERSSSEVADAARAVASRLAAIGQGTARFFISVGVMLYVLFFLFRDGTRLAAVLRRVSPLSGLHTNRLVEQFARVVHATVKGNFIIAAIQGTLGGIAFWILGIEGAPLWGALMAAVSLLPTFGAALAWAPVAAWLLLAGEYMRGVILLAVGVLVISMINNFLRPVLVGRGAGLPDCVVLVSTVGGLALFGVHGLVTGPLVAALFLAAWSLLDERRESGWTR